MRKAKEVLAFEATKISHGADAAKEAQQASRAIFGRDKHDLDGIPATGIDKALLKEGMNIVDLFHQVGLASSKSEARRLIQQGGGYINDEKIASIEKKVDVSYINDGSIILRAGKKRYHRVKIC